MKTFKKHKEKLEELHKFMECEIVTFKTKNWIKR
jgi:hypothetical protein